VAEHRASRSEYGAEVVNSVRRFHRLAAVWKKRRAKTTKAMRAQAKKDVVQLKECKRCWYEDEDGRRCCGRPLRLHTVNQNAKSAEAELLIIERLYSRDSGAKLAAVPLWAIVK
jgi:hypothetical protein